MSFEEQERKRYVAINAWQKIATSQGAIATCLNCEFWSDSKRTKNPIVQCTKYFMLPPPEVLVYGCPEWIQEIPF